MNYLNSVFWDYPKFKNERYLKKFIKKKDSDIYIWMLRRFIENGRVIDTFKYFKISDNKIFFADNILVFKIGYK